ncbi:MAG: tetraacyldisaccharide 4'-kinase [Nitrospinota bacterium]
MRRIKNLFASYSQKKPSELGVAGILLAALSRLYEAVVRIRLLLYRLSIFRAVRVDGIRVISVGNLTVGGSGKTPVTMLIAELLKDEGNSVCVINRGYGRLSRQPVQLVSNGGELSTPYPEASDEAVLCAQTLGSVPVISAPKRSDAIRTARDQLEATAAVLDDAFSHLAAARDKNILLVDALNPFGNGCLLPAGALREPLSSIARADCILITRAGAVSGEEIAEIKEGVGSYARDSVPIFSCDINAVEVIEPDGTCHNAKDYLAGRQVCLLSGIASPNQFEQMVRMLDSSVVGHYVYEDHHHFTEKEMEIIINVNRKESLLMTTEKDFIRLPSFVKKVARRLKVKAKIEKEELSEFKKYLVS